MVDINDCEPCEVFRSVFRRSRKDRACGCCHGPIVKGEHYHSVAWLADGAWSNCSQCVACRELTEDLTDDLVFFSDLETLAWDYDGDAYLIPVLRFRVRITKARLLRSWLQDYSETRSAHVSSLLAEEYSEACWDLYEALPKFIFEQE